MSDIYFFTELDNVKQDEGQQFGPIDSNNYRVTSLFKAKNLEKKPKVFAIVDGTMAIQKVNGNDKLVNIFIKPSKPISSITNNQFVPIKYFVYRGVSHSSIFSKEVTVDSKKEYEIIESLVKTDGVFKRAQVNFDKLNYGKNLKLNSSIFRYNLKFNDTDFLEKLFSNVADPDITLPEVKGGEYIANFDPKSYGIEIILDTIVENPKKDLAYTLENIITVETSNVENDFKLNTNKEKILNY